MGVIDGVDLINNGTATIVCKGSFNNLLVQSCRFSGGGKYDIELGQFDNYWKPGRPPTRNITVSLCARYDNKPVRIICWDSEVPLVLSSNVKITKVPKFIWFPYFLFRYLLAHLKGTFK